MADVDPALKQQILHVSQAQRVLVLCCTVLAMGLTPLHENVALPLLWFTRTMVWTSVSHSVPALRCPMFPVWPE
jgi:hypothetical protein